MARGTYAYSNTGYLIAGAMIERSWNGVFEDLMRDLVANNARDDADFGRVVGYEDALISRLITYYMTGQ